MVEVGFVAEGCFVEVIADLVETDPAGEFFRPSCIVGLVEFITQHEGINTVFQCHCRNVVGIKLCDKAEEVVKDILVERRIVVAPIL